MTTALTVRVLAGLPSGFVARPDWRNNDGSPVSDVRLIEDGYYPGRLQVVDYDPETHYTRQRPPADWPVEADRVLVTYDVLAYTPEERRVRLAQAVQDHLDQAVRERGYDSIHTCVGYAGEAAVPQYQTEGQAARAWRSLVWQACYLVMAEVEAGDRPIPTKAELLAELPVLVWPA